MKLAALLMTLIFASPALAQNNVTAQLEQQGRDGAIARTQVRLSISNHNYPPSQDWQNSYPNNVSGAPNYNSGRKETLGGKPKFHSIPYILYGIPN